MSEDITQQLEQRLVAKSLYEAAFIKAQTPCDYCGKRDNGVIEFYGENMCRTCYAEICGP